ncbi:synaptonemal complex central element protein 3 [Brachyistius frenatus]|uniref:synaptonemal complex central element protein 3 n=1 Tax=Brachyistius frenatus TaxID=100188 RepID=UPI0037E8CB9D
MSDSSLPSQLPGTSDDDDLSELNKNLERLTEDIEQMSVQLTWMAYDVVALRTSPELAAAMSDLEEAYHRCREAVCGDVHRETHADNCPGAAATTPAQI